MVPKARGFDVTWYSVQGQRSNSTGCLLHWGLSRTPYIPSIWLCVFQKVMRDIESPWNQLKATSREGHLSGAGKKVIFAPLVPNIRGDSTVKEKGEASQN